MIVFKQNISDFIISSNSIHCNNRPSFAISPCFSSKTLGHMILLPFSSMTFIGTNISARSDLTINFAYICVSFSHIKASTTTICHTKLPSLITISEPQTNLRYPPINFCHCSYNLKNIFNFRYHSLYIPISKQA